ncbi:MAG: hypothetical protein HYS86_05620, partial [Candidatus Chisholmbacteria bacterium]|nr:hypothetical protein [Candidatus Chisholmbacteria bacterium]
MPREFPSTEIPPLSDRSLVVSIGSDGSEGSDVVHLRENRFAVVDGPDWGRNDAIRQVATQAAQLLTSKNLDTYSDGSIDPLFGQHHELAHTTFAAGNTAQSFLHGYAR